MENDFWKKKEEFKNKIKDINTHWKNLELTYQTELKRRKNEKEKKITNEHIYHFLRIYLYLKCEKLMYDDFLNYYETYFHCVNYNTGERYYEIYYLMFFYHLYKKIRIEKDTNM